MYTESYETKSDAKVIRNKKVEEQKKIEQLIGFEYPDL